MQMPYKELKKHCNLWRNWVDIKSSWTSLASILTHWAEASQQSKGFTEIAGPGAWNDPDMLIIGNEVPCPLCRGLPANCLDTTAQQSKASRRSILVFSVLCYNDRASQNDQARLQMGALVHVCGAPDHGQRCAQLGQLPIVPSCRMQRFIAIDQDPAGASSLLSLPARTIALCRRQHSIQHIICLLAGHPGAGWCAASAHAVAGKSG